MKSKNINTQHRVASWFRSVEPSVIYADEFLVERLAKGPFPIKGPTEPGWWWGADDGWTGPFPTEAEARADGRSFLRHYFGRQQPQRRRAP